jgi:hypothetical protein
MKPAVSGYCFAWRPVRLGALSTGELVWLKTVWFCTAMGVTIYQDAEDIRRMHARLADAQVEKPFFTARRGDARVVYMVEGTDCNYCRWLIPPPLGEWPS